jgi:biopolymer transport protein ExbD
MKIQFKERKRAVTLIAMSDIAFLLLIFLIVIINVKSDNSVVLPEFKYSVKAYPEDMFLLTVDKSGEIFADEKRLNPDQLPEYIENAYKNGRRIIGIYADKETDYEYVSSILNIIRKSLIYNVILITEREESVN